MKIRPYGPNSSLLADCNVMANSFVLITGAAKRIGRSLALAAASLGYDIALHWGTSAQQAQQTADEIRQLGVQVLLLQADLNNPAEAASLIPAVQKQGDLFALVNNASIFEPGDLEQTTWENWNRHLMINVSAPFLLSQAFVKALGPQQSGRIINLLDYRALRTDPNHLAYTISKAALASLTHNLAVACAPLVTVNGIALGAVLPPSSATANESVLDAVPARRWADLHEVDQTFAFLLEGPSYITGQIIHVDGGRHLV